MVPNLKKGDRDRAHIVFIDETGLSLAPILRRTWAPKGLRPHLIQRAGHRQKISIIGALTLSPQDRKSNLFTHSLPNGTFNSKNVAVFLRELLKHLRGKIIVVWDNGSMHKGDAMRQLLKDYPRLTLEWLPPYAPELNPVEQLWSHLKFGHFANFIPKDINELEDEAFEFLVDVKFRPQTLQSYWSETPLAESIPTLSV